MAQWGNTDDAANSVLWATSQLNLTANTANQTDLFGNTTADAFVTGVTVGQYGVDAGEAQASGDIAHAGWVLRTEGSGGRAGRVHHEVLVAMSTITGDAADDTVIPDYAIVITSQPTASFSDTNGIQNLGAVFGTTVAVTDPTGGSLSYQWEFSDDGATGWTNVTTAVGITYGGATTPTLTVDVTSGTNDINSSPNNDLFYRLKISVTGGADVYTETRSITLT